MTDVAKNGGEFKGRKPWRDRTQGMKENAQKQVNEINPDTALGARIADAISAIFAPSTPEFDSSGVSENHYGKVTVVLPMVKDTLALAFCARHRVDVNDVKVVCTVKDDGAGFNITTPAGDCLCHVEDISLVEKKSKLLYQFAMFSHLDNSVFVVDIKFDK